MRTVLAKLVAIVLAAAACGLPSPAGAATALKAITYAPLSKVEDSMVIFKAWVDRVNSESQGDLTIELLGGPEVFPVSDQINALSKGLVDVVMTYRFRDCSHGYPRYRVSFGRLRSASMRRSRLHSWD
jgi:TRAP-type C4-dicarboxylate transport system substrate-binding protein